MELPGEQPFYTQQLHEIAVLDERFRALIAASLDLNFSSLEAMEWLMREGPLTPTQLAQRLGLTQGAVTAVIKRLETTGHASRGASADDARSVQITPAPASVAQATATLMPLIQDMLERTSRYTADEIELVQRFLGDVSDVYRRGIDGMTRET